MLSVARLYTVTRRITDGKDLEGSGSNILLVPRNSSRGRGVIPSLAELGEQSYQLTSAWVPPVWNVA
jgi:hypothetical protein